MTGLDFQHGLPRRALALDLEVIDGDGKRKVPERRALVYAQQVEVLERRLRERGVAITHAADANEAVKRLATERFDVVVLDAHAPGGGLTLVKAVKLGVGVVDVPAGVRTEANQRARDTPFVVLPLSGTEYAVIVRPPMLAFLEDGAGVSVEDAIARFDVGRLLAGGPPLA